jgi:hypothetical protein
MSNESQNSLIRESTADTCLMKLQRLQKRVLHTNGNFLRHTPVCDMLTAFQIPYVYNYITKLCRQQAQVSQNYENTDVHNIGQDKTKHRK